MWLKAIYIFELTIPVQYDSTYFQIVYLDLVICLKATCSNILQADIIILFLAYATFNSL